MPFIWANYLPLCLKHREKKKLIRRGGRRVKAGRTVKQGKGVKAESCLTAFPFLKKRYNFE